MNIKLLCRIADIDNAIRISGDGNGLRLVLDFPDVDLENIVPTLITVRDQLLVLDLKTEDEDHHDENHHTNEHAPVNYDHPETRPQSANRPSSSDDPNGEPVTDIDGLSSEIKNHLATMAWIEVRFAIAYLYANNRADAARDVGIRREYTYNSARQDGDDFEGRVTKLIELMKQACVESAIQLVQHAAIKAAGDLIRNLDDPNANTRMRAARLVMEYAIGKPVARSVTEGKVEHEHSVSKLYAVDPAWPGVDVEHVMPSSDDVVEGEFSDPTSNE